MPVYNVPALDQSDSLQTLVLDRTTLADIFIGTITVWNDPKILDLQSTAVKTKLVTAGPMPIIVVVRSDGSGSTEVFTKSLDL